MNTDVRRIVSMIKLLGDLPQFIRKKDGPESAFRFKGMYMNIPPIISLSTSKNFFENSNLFGFMCLYG